MFDDIQQIILLEIIALQRKQISSQHRLRADMDALISLLTRSGPGFATAFVDRSVSLDITEELWADRRADEIKLDHLSEAVLTLGKKGPEKRRYHGTGGKNQIEAGSCILSSRSNGIST